jgi:hypothetical protein
MFVEISREGRPELNRLTSTILVSLPLLAMSCSIDEDGCVIHDAPFVASCLLRYQADICNAMMKLDYLQTRFLSFQFWGQPRACTFVPEDLHFLWIQSCRGCTSGEVKRRAHEKHAYGV